MNAEEKEILDQINLHSGDGISVPKGDGFLVEPLLDAKIKETIDKGIKLGLEDFKDEEIKKQLKHKNPAAEFISIENEAGLYIPIYFMLCNACSVSWIKNNPNIKIRTQVNISAKDIVKPDFEIYDSKNRVSLIMLEAKELKRGKIEEAYTQNIKQIMSYADSHKVKHCFGVATTYKEWIFTRYDSSLKGTQTSKSIFIGNPLSENLEAEVELIKYLRAVFVLSYTENGCFHELPIGWNKE